VPELHVDVDEPSHESPVGDGVPDPGGGAGGAGAPAPLLAGLGAGGPVETVAGAEGGPLGAQQDDPGSRVRVGSVYGLRQLVTQPRGDGVVVAGAGEHDRAHAIGDFRPQGGGHGPAGSLGGRGAVNRHVFGYGIVTIRMRPVAVPPLVSLVLSA